MDFLKKRYNNHESAKSGVEEKSGQADIPPTLERSALGYSFSLNGNAKSTPQHIFFENDRRSADCTNTRKISVKNNTSQEDKSDIDNKMFSSEAFGIKQCPPAQIPMFRRPQADGDGLLANPDLVADHTKREEKTKTTKLQTEVCLKDMGLGQDTAIDWSNVSLPAKSPLHDLLHITITRFINPDVFIKIDNHEYRCHMLVLQCYSKYFLEYAAPRIELPENQVTKSAFTYIYNWMLHLDVSGYTTVLRRDNILEIFMAAHFLNIEELTDQCWAFINNEELFSEDNAFMLYSDAKRMVNPTIMELMVPRIQRFFLTLVSSKDFLELTVEELSVFLMSNYININCEMEVFMSGVRWLMADWDQRKEELVTVMSCVRFGLISPWQLVDIRRNPQNKEFLTVTQHPEVSKMIDDGMAFAVIKNGLESSDKGHAIEQLGLTKPSPRNWSGTTKIYHTYREFLVDLSRLQQLHLAKRGSGDRSTSRESLAPELTA